MSPPRVGCVALAVALSCTAPAWAANPKPEPTPEPGIYLEPAKDAKDTSLSKLEGSTPVRAGMKDLKKGIASTMLTGGLLGGPKMTSVFTGAKSARRVASGAWFQFHFDPKAAAAPQASRAPATQEDMMAMMQQQMEAQSAGASGMPAGARSPQDFVLVKIEVKNDERLLVTSMDMKVKNTLPFRMRQLGPSAYRVAPEKPLPPGEYGFFAPPKQSGGGSSLLWDFGVDKD
jgi:hypothetical protein